jgi:DNA-binding response OmpR family regulator
MHECPRQGEIALIVSRERAAAELTAALAAVGYVVVEVPSFVAARHRLCPELRLLITDLRLGDYNGLHLILVAKHQRPDLLAIAVAETPDDVLQREAELMEATFIVRPERESDLTRVVLELIRSRTRPGS